MVEVLNEKRPVRQPSKGYAIDRQLEEALTHGPDPLHLAAVFGLDQKTISGCEFRLARPETDTRRVLGA